MKHLSRPRWTGTPHLASSAILLCLLACGPKPQNDPQPVLDTTDPAASFDAGNQEAQSEQRLAEADCEALFAHVFSVAFESQRASLPEDQRPTEADLLTAKDQLRREIFSQCVGASPEAFHFECAMAADTPAAMESCLGGE